MTLKNHLIVLLNRWTLQRKVWVSYNSSNLVITKSFYRIFARKETLIIPGLNYPNQFLGSQSNRSSVNSLLSVSSLTGRSTYNINKQSSLDKFDSFRKSSMDISSSSAKNVKNFISGVITPRLTRKNINSASSDTLKSESVENMSQVGLFLWTMIC